MDSIINYQLVIGGMGVVIAGLSYFLNKKNANKKDQKEAEQELTNRFDSQEERLSEVFTKAISAIENQITSAFRKAEEIQSACSDRQREQDAKIATLTQKQTEATLTHSLQIKELEFKLVSGISETRTRQLIDESKGHLENNIRELSKRLDDVGNNVSKIAGFLSVPQRNRRNDDTGLE